MEHIPNFLYIDQQSKAIVDMIKDENYLSMKGDTNLSMFLYAMALGSNHRKKHIKRKDFVRREYISNDLLAEPLILSLGIGKFLEEQNLDDLIGSKKSFIVAEENANYGFSIIENTIKTSSIESIEMKLTNELDSIYSSITFDE